MDKQQADQIMESLGVIEVKYQDAPVWIEQVKDSDTAEVTILGSNERMEVPLRKLEKK